MDRQKKLVLAVVFGLLALSVLAVVLGLKARGTYIKVVVLPNDATVRLDGEPIKAGRIKVTPGVHTFTATRQYFDDVTKKIDTNSFDLKQPLYLLPQATSPEALQWLKDHPEVQRQREAAGGADAIASQQTLTSKYPFITKLPYENLDFKIDYSTTDNNTVTFTVTLYIIGSPGSPDYNQAITDQKQEALDYLKTQGLDTTKAAISYVVSQ